MGRSVTVNAPDGREWVVSRRWGRGPRWRQVFTEHWDAALNLGGALDVPGIAAWLAIGSVFGLLVAFFMPLVLFTAEAVFLAAGYYLLRGLWRIEAVTANTPPQLMTWH